MDYRPALIKRSLLSTNVTEQNRFAFVRQPKKFFEKSNIEISLEDSKDSYKILIELILKTWVDEQIDSSMIITHD